MYSVSSELYHEAAARLSDAIDGGNYFSGSLAFRFWWEFHTTQAGGEVLNDFDFSELKRYV